MITKEEFSKVLTNPEWFIQGSIYTIIDGKDTKVNETYKSYTDYISNLPTLIENKTVFKIQDLEKFNSGIVKKCSQLFDVWKKPVNCHAYWGYADTTSFDKHTDPCEVCIYICEGNKQIDLDQQQSILREGQHLYIKANEPHAARNITDCLSLSFGTEDFSESYCTTGMDISL